MKSDSKDLIKEIELFLENNSVNELSDEHLISLIIRSGDSTKTVLELSKNILRRYGKAPRDLIGITHEELLKDNKGLNKTRAIQLSCAIELGKRAYLSKDYSTFISKAEDLVDILSYEMNYLNQEHFKVALLNSKNALISVEDIFVGTLNESIIHAREVFSVAIKKHANSIILCHNHPSGYPDPSDSDINITQRLTKAGEILGIYVLDHIIIAKEGFYSFRENKLI